MEPSYDFTNRCWYKPDGQKQTQTVRMRTAHVVSPPLSNDTSYTNSNSSSNSKASSPSKSRPAAAAAAMTSDRNTRRDTNPNKALAHTSKESARPHHYYHHYHPQRPGRGASLSSEGSKSYFSTSTERALLTKPKPKYPYSANAHLNENTHAGSRAKTRQAPPIYVHELDPSRSWYRPRPAVADVEKQKRSYKDRDSEQGFMKSWYTALRRRLFHL